MNLNWIELKDAEKYQLVWAVYEKLASTKKPRPVDVEKQLRQECAGVPSAINSFNSVVKLFADATYGKQLINVTNDLKLNVPDDKPYRVYATERAYHDGEKTVAPLVLEIDGVIRKVIPAGTDGKKAVTTMQNAVRFVRVSTPMGVK